MLRKIVTGIVILAVMACIGCKGDDEILALDTDVYDTVVAFRVKNGAFKNIGTGGDTYTATVVGGSYTTSQGRNVYTTGGTENGLTYVVPWFDTATWKRYSDIGYVSLNQATADLLATSAAWSVETIFALPPDSRTDIVDQYVWGAYNYEPDVGFANYMIGFCWREIFLRVVDNGGPLGDFAALGANDTRAGDWAASDTVREGGKGAWKHVVVTKTASGTVTIYVDGIQTGSGVLGFEGTTQTHSSFPVFTAGSFTRFWLGKCPYPIGGAQTPNGEGTYGDDLVNTAYYHFAIDDKAWSASEVTKRYADSPMGKGQMLIWE